MSRFIPTTLLICLFCLLIIAQVNLLDQKDVMAFAQPVDRTSESLRWPPPELIEPKVIVIQDVSTSAIIYLDPQQDYIIQMPDQPVHHRLVISGGHNIVLIGGEILIPWQGANPSIASRTALKIKNATGVVHIEGLLLHGDDISEGIQIDAPQATVQLENIGIFNVHARDEVTFSDNHPDIIQTYGNVATLRIDHLTGTSDYQGFFFQTSYNGPHGSIQISRTNIIGAPTARKLIWFEEEAGASPVTLDEVWIAAPSGKTFGSAVWPTIYGTYPAQAQLGVNEQNVTFVNWPEEMSPLIVGQVLEGIPPEGSFVSPEAVGVGYVSPGYIDVPTNPTEIVPSDTETNDNPVPTEMPSDTNMRPGEPTLLMRIAQQGANVGDQVDVTFELVNAIALFGLQADCFVTPGTVAAYGFTEGNLFNIDNSVIIGNQVDNFDPSTGRWLVAATRLHPSPAIDGSGVAFGLSYITQIARDTTINCSVVGVDTDGTILSLDLIKVVETTEATPIIEAALAPGISEPEIPVSSPISESSVLDTISGQVRYQNRPHNAGISVELLNESQETVNHMLTSADGRYAFDRVEQGTYTLRYTAPQHITLLYDVVVEVDGQSLDLGQIGLQAGDVNNDGSIDLLDASFIAANYGLAVMPEIVDEDLNGDNIVDISDLAIIGGNFGVEGPIIQNP